MGIVWELFGNCLGIVWEFGKVLDSEKWVWEFGKVLERF
jgi:hypothetical protein